MLAPREIGQEENSPFQDADEVQVSVGVILGDLCAELANTILNFRGGDEDRQLGIRHGALDCDTFD